MSMYLSDFTCSTTYVAGTYLAENDEIGVTCRVEFGGWWKPGFTCELAGNRLIVSYRPSGVSEVVGDFRGKAVRDFNNQSIVCGVRFRGAMKPSSSLSTADNLPTYDPQWTFDTLLVTCEY